MSQASKPASRTEEYIWMHNVAMFDWTTNISTDVHVLQRVIERNADSNPSYDRVFARDMLDSLTGVRPPPLFGLLFLCSKLPRGKEN
jgi:hypothetical protein